MSYLKKILFIFFVVLLVSCGSNNSDAPVRSDANTSGGVNESIDTNGSASLVFASGSSATLSENNQAYIVDILVLGPDNAPLSSGKVSIAYPDKIKNGVDIGYFGSNTVDIENGHAKFSYVGPQDLKERVDAGDTSTQFGFYLSDQPQNVSVFTFNYQPVSNQIILTDYDLGWNKQLSETSVGLNSSTQLNFYIENDKQEKISDNDVVSVKVSLMNDIATLKDTYGNSGNSLTFSSKNNISVTFSSKTVSGLVPIRVDATFKDANSEEKNLTKVFNMTILSGPPTAISISYAGTDIDTDQAKFIEKMIVRITDKYSNFVNTQPAISASLIAGYKKDAVTGNRLYFTTQDASTATLDPNTNTLSVSNGVNLANVDKDTDFVATFGNGYSYDASGKWDIASLDGNSTINLVDDFNASSSATGLGYAIGNNYRQDTCRDSQEWIGYVKVNNTNGNVFTKEGYAEIDINYDYYLTGKKVVLAINILGKDVNSGTIKRLGESRALTLRSTGFDGYSVSIPAGATDMIIQLPVMISNTGEWLRNANFGYDLKTSDSISVNNYKTVSNIGTCLNGGIAYVEANVTNTDATKAGTVSIDNILIGDEF